METKALLGRVLTKVRTLLHPVRTIDDEYLNWLRFANAGMLDSGNSYSFDFALQRLPSRAPMLEIGSFCGLSTNVLGYLKAKHGIPNRLYTCDRWVFERNDDSLQLGASGMTHEAYRDFVKETFQRNVRFFSGVELPWTIELFSDEFFDAWRRAEKATTVFGEPVTLGGPLSFCYIDGNHSYEYARRDFQNADQFLEKGGYILFDDSADGSGWEVCRVVDEVLKSKQYELALKNPNYLLKKL